MKRNTLIEQWAKILISETTEDILKEDYNEGYSLKKFSTSKMNKTNPKWKSGENSEAWKRSVKPKIEQSIEMVKRRFGVVVSFDEVNSFDLREDPEDYESKTPLLRYKIKLSKDDQEVIDCLIGDPEDNSSLKGFLSRNANVKIRNRLVRPEDDNKRSGPQIIEVCFQPID